ncbi:hypothetical protein B7486_11790 [cyanobacterium TDX16]|nr:hypothetical protein B7486_11790 [cyanobacterium TDX16]
MPRALQGAPDVAGRSLILLTLFSGSEETQQELSNMSEIDRASAIGIGLQPTFADQLGAAN